MEVDLDQMDSMLSKPENSAGEQENPKEKGGLLKKVFNFLMEEEEEPENENLKLSKENQEILDGLEEETSAAGKKKEKAKPKKKKDKKPKKQKAAKPKKAPKPKKEKKKEWQKTGNVCGVLYYYKVQDIMNLYIYSEEERTEIVKLG